MKNWLWATCLLVVTSCSGVEQSNAPAAPEAPAAKGVQYLVYVDRLELHTNPKESSDVVTTLAHGDIVLSEFKVVTDEAEQWWRFVRCGDRQGWALDYEIIPVNVYELCRAADEGGKNGNAENAIAALQTAKDKYETNTGHRLSDFDTFFSPDKQNALVSWQLSGDSSDDDIYRWGNYPDAGRLGCCPLILTLFAGMGITSFSHIDSLLEVPLWSADSQVVAIPSLYVVEYGTDEGALSVFTSRLWRHATFKPVKWIITGFIEDIPQFDMEFCADYFLWAQRTPVPEPRPKYLEHNSFIPELKMLDLTTSETVTLLTADAKHAKPAGTILMTCGGNIKKGD